MSFASLTAGFCLRSRISSRTLKSILFWKKNLTFHRPAINTIGSLCVPWIIPRAEAEEQSLQGSIISWLFASQAVWLFSCCHQHLVSQSLPLPGWIQSPPPLDLCRSATVLYNYWGSHVHCCLCEWFHLDLGSIQPAQPNLTYFPERISAHLFKYFSSMFSPSEWEGLGEINKVYYYLCPFSLPSQCLVCKRPRVHNKWASK